MSLCFSVPRSTSAGGHFTAPKTNSTVRGSRACWKWWNDRRTERRSLVSFDCIALAHRAPLSGFIIFHLALSHTHTHTPESNWFTSFAHAGTRLLLMALLPKQKEAKKKREERDSVFLHVAVFFLSHPVPLGATHRVSERASFLFMFVQPSAFIAGADTVEILAQSLLRPQSKVNRNPRERVPRESTP